MTNRMILCKIGIYDFSTGINLEIGLLIRMLL